jgi:molybdopterin molybdotransferase/putative molybdopterin biosynthesis protein
MEFDTLTREEALQRLFALWKPPHRIELVPLEQSAGRISGTALRSRLTLPVCRASARDGIAVRSADFLNGQPDTSLWQNGRDYVRADTGDDFHDRFDAVIEIEFVAFNADGSLSLTEPVDVRPGLNINGRGEAILEGEVILEQGLPIRACDMGALARGGLWDVPVLKKPLAAFIPTGNELIPPRQNPKRGENIDTNSVMSRQMLDEMGAVPVMFPIIKDDPAKIKAALLEALAKSDIVILNAGSSKGSDDYNTRLLSELGTLICHGVYAAPGRPASLAVIHNKAVVNIPGPMLAAWFGMDWCVRALVCHALNIPVPIRPTLTATLSENAGPGELPEGFEFLSRIELCRTASGFEAWPVPFGREEGRRTLGFHNAQSALTTGNTTKGSQIKAELLWGEEFIPHKER